jgi:hypothetical protein
MHLAWLIPLLADVPLASGVAEPDPSPIYGGDATEVCAWPTVASVRGPTAVCSGTLIHPLLVTSAAHCGGGPKTVVFADEFGGASLEIAAQCTVNGAYDPDPEIPFWDQADDYAVCVLEEPAPFAITPPLFGCEVDILQPGLEFAVVGFGQDAEGTVDRKRWGTTVLSSVGEGVASAFPTPATACRGDSGGPAFVQLDDGGWRTFGTTSTSNLNCNGAPEGFTVWGLLHEAIPFIEAVSGIDVTPCHDADGTWNPTPQCQGFSAGGADGYGSWADACSGTPVSGSSASCGPAFDAVPDGLAPQVDITAPADETIYGIAPAEVTIEIAADDGDGWGVRVVRVAINGEVQGVELFEPPYVLRGDFPRGGYEIVGIAEDWAGNVAQTPVLRIAVDDELPPLPGSESGESSAADGTGSAEGSGGSDEHGTGDPIDVDTGADPDATTLGGAADETGGDAGCGCAGGRSGGDAALPLIVVALARRRSHP